MTPFPRRAGHEIIGRGGVRLADKWAAGPATLHGMMTRGFPNLFIMPAPGQQGVIIVNFTVVELEGAEHIAATVKLLEEHGVRVFDVSEEAETQYVDADRRHVQGRERGDGSLHPVPAELRGQPQAMNPRSRQLGRRSRRPLRLDQDAEANGARRATSPAWRLDQPVAATEREDSCVGWEENSAVNEKRATACRRRDRRSGRDRRGDRRRARASRRLRRHAGSDGLRGRLEPPRRRRTDTRPSGSSRQGDRPGLPTPRSPTARRSRVSSPSWSREFGALDAVVNVAGITRPTDSPSGTEDDWAAVLERASRRATSTSSAPPCPCMAEAGHGQILGVTSGSGWRPANAGRLRLRQAGRRRPHLADRADDPAGVTVNALSPIAAHPDGDRRARPRPARPAPTGRRGPAAWTSAPCHRPRHLGPVGAYLASEQFSWCQRPGDLLRRGRGGLAPAAAPPRGVPHVRCRIRASRVLEAAMVPGLRPRRGRPGHERGEQSSLCRGLRRDRCRHAPRARAGCRTCVVVTDDPAWGAVVSDALAGDRGSPASASGRGSASRSVASEVAHDFEGGREPDRPGGQGGRTPRRRRRRPGGPGRRITDLGLGALAGHPRRARRRRRANPGRRRLGPCRVGLLGERRPSGSPRHRQRRHHLGRSKPGPGRSPAGPGRPHRVPPTGSTPSPSASRRPRTQSARRSPSWRPTFSGAPDTSGSLGCRTRRGHRAGSGCAVIPAPATSISFGGPAVPVWLDGILRSIVTGSTD